MNETCLFNGLATGVGAAKAVHSNLKEESCGLNIIVEDVADKCILCNLHFKITFLLFYVDSIAQQDRKINRKEGKVIFLKYTIYKQIKI